MNKKTTKKPTLDRGCIAADVQAFLARGGKISSAQPARRNPINEDRHNTFLFLSPKR